MIIVGCDGKKAEETAPAPMAKPTSPPAPTAPVAMAAVDVTVNFAFDRADLNQQATAAIETLVRQAKSRGGIKAARLTGHPDRIGTEDYNLDLSLRRAGSVGDYLVQGAGIDPQAIGIAGKGESQPLVGCEVGLVQRRFAAWPPTVGLRSSSIFSEALRGGPHEPIAATCEHNRGMRSD